MKYFKTLILILISNIILAQNHKPYILASVSDGTLSEISENVNINLLSNGFEILGKYSPANDPNREVLIVTTENLKNAVNDEGGLLGFAATLRVALKEGEDGVNISYTNPIYWGNAYWRTKFESVENIYNEINSYLNDALSNIGTQKNEQFGSEDGISEKSLRKYRYMIGMEKFDNTVELNEFDSHEEAVQIIDSNLADSEDLVYSIALPDAKLKLYGIVIGGEKGEDKFLPIIDITSPKHTAFLPYELLVVDKQAIMLHGRYRIALSFPDLTMMTFSKIMSTPGDIKKALKEYTK